MQDSSIRRRSSRKSSGKSSKFGSKIKEKSMKFEALGRLCSIWVNPWRQDGPRCSLGRVWGCIRSSIGAYLGAKMGQVGAKMALCWPTWRQDVSKMCPSWPTWSLRWATWRAFGSILAIFLDDGGDLARTGENQKNDDSTALLKVFWGLGGALGGHVSSS